MLATKHGLIAVLGGLLTSAGIVALVLASGTDNPVSATVSARPTFIVLVADETRSRLIDANHIQKKLNLIPTNSPGRLASDVTRLDADGVILDEITSKQLPQGVLGSLFAEGRVLAIFGIEKQEILKLAESNRAFPDADLRYIPDVTLNPGTPTGSYRSPFFSVVFRTRPGLTKVGGGETTREFAPPIFSVLLTERAMNARGITTMPEGAGTGAR